MRWWSGSDGQSGRRLCCTLRRGGGDGDGGIRSDGQRMARNILTIQRRPSYCFLEWTRDWLANYHLLIVLRY